MKKSASLLLSAFVLPLLFASGCGTSANLSGLSVGLNVAQKGVVAGVTFGASTNSITVGATYDQGTNQLGGSVTIPTK